MNVTVEINKCSFKKISCNIIVVDWCLSKTISNWGSGTLRASNGGSKSCSLNYFYQINCKRKLHFVNGIIFCKYCCIFLEQNVKVDRWYNRFWPISSLKLIKIETNINLNIIARLLGSNLIIKSWVGLRGVFWKGCSAVFFQTK